MFFPVSWIPEGCPVGWGLTARKGGVSLPMLQDVADVQEKIMEDLNLFDLDEDIWDAYSEKF